MQSVCRIFLILPILFCLFSCQNVSFEETSSKSLLSSTDPALRCNAAMEVGEKNKVEEIGQLKQMLEDRDGRVQYCVAWSLTKLNQKEGVAKLLEIIQSEKYMEDLSEGFDYQLLAKALKIKEPTDFMEWNRVIAKHPEWKKIYK